MTADWVSVESQVKLIISSIRSYNLPAELYGVNPEFEHLLEYLNKHKLELEYQRSIAHDNSSCLEFVQFAIKHMIQKLLIYAELEELQERSGGVNAIILIALGTLIWLIS